MRIAILGTSIVPIHAKSLDERPLGGTETGIIHLAAELQKRGCDVTVYTTHDNPPASPRGSPRYLNKADIEKSEPLDVYISVRDWIPLLYGVRAKKRFLWTGDSYDQLPNFGIGDKRVSHLIDGLLTVSDWQSNSLCTASGFPREKVFVLRNGIDGKLFEGNEKRNPFRFIYSSTPYRGLEYAPLLFGKLREEFPQLELHVFSGYRVYDQNENEFASLRESLQKVPGVQIHGNILQKDLAREFMKSSILFYPCHFEETSCITAMEAMAAGCIPVTTNLAALPETIGDAGQIIQGLPIEEHYQRDFIAACRKILKEPALFESLSQRARERAKSMTWSAIAERFLDSLKSSV